MAQVLNGTDDELFTAWRKLVEKQKTQNANPDDLEERYLNEVESPEKMNYARYELMTYGWWNCVNSERYTYTDYERLQKEFLKLFKKVEMEEEDGD